MAEESRLVVSLPESIKITQKALWEWQQKNFPGEAGRPEWLALGVVEEVGELAHALLKNRQKIREFANSQDEEEFKALIADALGDVIVYGLNLMSSLGIDFGQALAKTVSEVLARNWTENRTDGS